jgi:hypothetical protein
MVPLEMNFKLCGMSFLLAEASKSKFSLIFQQNESQNQTKTIVSTKL